MKTNRDFPASDSPSASALIALVDSSAAAQAAARLYRTNRQGVRYCCDSRELLTAEEGLARDAREAARRAPKSKSVDEPAQEPVAIEVPVNTIEMGAFDEDNDDFADLDTSGEDDHLVDLDDDEIVDADPDERLFDEMLEADFD